MAVTESGHTHQRTQNKMTEKLQTQLSQKDVYFS